MQYSWAVHLTVLPCPLPIFGMTTNGWTSVFRLPGDTAGPREHISTHSELLMCLEQEKLFPHLGKNTIPSLTLSGWYFATSRLISVVFRLKYICSCVVEIPYLYNTFAFKVLRTTSLFLQCLPPRGARGKEEVWSTCLLQRRVKANPEGRQKGPLSVLFFSASSSHVLKEIVLLVISDDYIHKIRPWNIIPVLDTDHLQSLILCLYFDYLCYLGHLAGAKSLIILIASVSQDVFWEKMFPELCCNLLSRIWSFGSHVRSSYCLEQGKVLKLQYWRPWYQRPPATALHPFSLQFTRL